MKICLVSFGFDEYNYRLQPWNYTYQLAKAMIRLGHEVVICTTYNINRIVYNIFDGITILKNDGSNVLKLAKNNKFNDFIANSSTDVILWPIGPTNFYHIPIIRKMNVPVVGVFFGPLHSLNEFKRINLYEILRNRRFILIPLLSSLIPKYLFRKLLATENIKSIIVLSNRSKKELQDIYSEKPIFVFPPGLQQKKHNNCRAVEIDNYRNKYALKSNFVLLYFGSPLTIRGLDLAIKSVYLLKKDIPQIKLLILSRKRDDYDKEEKYIRKLICDLDLTSEVTIVSGFLSPTEVIEYISISDCILLPFKFLQADMPLSILESLELKKIVVSTNVGGIPDWLKDNGILIEPNNLMSLKEAVLYVYNNPNWAINTTKKIEDYISNYPSWDNIAKNIIDSMEDSK